ncbi:MAG: hypothetical protein DMG63_05955 [Acidobacteria bacterium]|nr:MAG: hypothetical protein DMG63_05955 [Acidobacteriota bacterium]
MRKDTPACSSYRVRAVESTYPAEPQPLRPGCERMSPRHQSFEMGLPPFRGAVRQIILFSTAVYIALLLMLAFAPGLGQAAFAVGILQPEKVLHGSLWQLVTYPFMYADPIAFLLSLVGIYFIGSPVESQIGSQRFYGLFFGSLIVAGAVGVALSRTGVIAQGTAVGSGAAADAILMVHAVFASRRFDQPFRATLRTPQFLLPLEASSCGQEVSGVHAQARPQRLFRRVRQLQAAR